MNRWEILSLGGDAPSPPPYPLVSSPCTCFPPGPSLLRHSARGDVGVGNSATHGGNATSERMALREGEGLFSLRISDLHRPHRWALREGEDLFSLQISIDPIGGLVQVEASRGAGGVSLRCFLPVCLLLALLCCPPPPPPRPSDEGQGPPHCSALFAARFYRLGGFSGQVRSSASCLCPLVP